MASSSFFASSRSLFVHVALALALGAAAACSASSSSATNGVGGGASDDGCQPDDCSCWGCDDGEEDGWEGATSGPINDTSPVILAAKPPPPVTGGTLIVAHDGKTAIAADPDRDLVYWADTSPEANAIPAASVAMEPGDEPGRLVQDAAGLVHVALRGGGAVATIDLSTGAVVRRTDVCTAPRGIGYDPDDATIDVACAGGELVKLSATDDTVVRTVLLDRDLRDVVELGQGFVAVTKLRTAEVLLVDATGAVRSRARPSSDLGDPDVAWRAIAAPKEQGAIVVAHQVASTASIDLSAPNGWSGGGGPDVVESAVSTFRFDLSSPDAPPVVSTELLAGVGALPVDLAISPTRELTIISYGDQAVATRSKSGELSEMSIGYVTSVAYAGARWVAFAREPATFVFADEQWNIPLPEGVTAMDTGHDLFHFDSRVGGSLACASCHPEGRDDGRAWKFDGLGERRTPSLAGGVLATAPFHWQGELKSMKALVSEVYTNRMGGEIEDKKHVDALGRFVDAIRPVKLAAPSDANALAHGQELFESPDVGCSSCHSGPHFTNNASVDVGIEPGKAFQIPSLVGVGMRAPYLHDGCAKTLADRFGPCGGGDAHGHTSQLSQGDISDLVTYLDTL